MKKNKSNIVVTTQSIFTTLLLALVALGCTFESIDLTLAEKMVVENLSPNIIDASEPWHFASIKGEYSEDDVHPIRWIFQICSGENADSINVDDSGIWVIAGINTTLQTDYVDQSNNDGWCTENDANLDRADGGPRINSNAIFAAARVGALEELLIDPSKTYHLQMRTTEHPYTTLEESVWIVEYFDNGVISAEVYVDFYGDFISSPAS